jgi:UDP-N-acetyl-D-mannosaminuronate dehydrogenase
MDFLNKLLERRTVSVWGIGYLAYTTIIRLQANGFHCNVWDFFPERLAGLAEGTFPQPSLSQNWSQVNKLPRLDMERITLCAAQEGADLDRMFDSPVHVVSFSGVNYDDPGDNRIRRLAVEFIRRKERLADALVVFQSAEVPGNIDRFFLAPLAQAGVQVDCLAAFRSDWTLEEFLAGDGRRVIAPSTPDSLEKGQAFYSLLGVTTTELPSIRAAEVYENAKSGLAYLTGAYFCQLALAYPGLDMARVLSLAAENFRPEKPILNFGMAGNRMFTAVSNILEGGQYPEELTLVKEAQSVNVSLILKYGDFMVKQGISSVLILGLSTLRNVHLAEISPALILANYLRSQGVEVQVEDPFYSAEEIRAMLPFVRICDLERDGLSADALFILADYYRFKFAGWEALQGMGLDRARLIFDSPGMLRNYSFPESTLYHAPGDGRLDILES